jgi:mono/diheme cytochrome c family protein
MNNNGHGIETVFWLIETEGKRIMAFGSKTWAALAATLATGTALRAAEPPVTFSEHIAPIVFAQCADCHRPGQAGPFPLLSYKDVAQRAETIRVVVSDRYMPPWHPVPGHGEFAGERRLTDEQIAMFGRWIEAGKPEGPADKLPPLPSFPADGWQLGEPDLIVQMDEGFSVPADGPDVYRSFVIPLDLPEDKWVRALEFRPSARNVVHHSLFFLDSRGIARLRDRMDDGPGFKGMIPPTGRLGGYVPGGSVLQMPEGLGMPLPKGSDLIFQTHFHPAGKPEVEKSTLALYFLDGPSKKVLVPIQVPPGFGVGMGINIPAGEKEYRVVDEFTLPVAVDCWDIGGHAHYICKQLTMTATLPDGTVKPMLRIDDWNLNWQNRYQYKEPVALPAGTVLRTELVYDNSEENPHNPNSPPKRVRWGRQSTDEMGSITVTVTAQKESDVPALVRAGRNSMIESLRPSGALAERLLERMRGTSGEEQPAEAPQPSPLSGVLKRLDTNNDGVLSREEVPERYRTRVFDALDGDNNGKLEGDELEVLKARLPGLLGR